MRAADSGDTAKKFVARLAGRVSLERQKNRPLIGRRPCHRPALWPTETELLDALARAWSVATIAVVLLSGALALAPMWDRTIFLQALREALSANPDPLQPADEAPVDAPADYETSASHLARINCLPGRGPQGDC